MSDELPQSWCTTTLGEVATLVAGAGFPRHLQNRKGLPFPFFKVGNLGEVASGKPLTDSKHTVDEEIVNALGAKIIPQDAVVFAKIGMAIALNRRRLTGQPACIDNNMMAAIPSGAILPHYLVRFLETIDFMPLSRSTTVPSIRKGELERLAVPLPPLAEQQRIVTKAEDMLEKLDVCQKRLVKASIILKQFRQSVLATACSGRLTADWRDEESEVGDASSLVHELEHAHAAAGGHKRGNAALPTAEAHDLSLDELPRNWCLTELRTAVCPDRPITYGILKPGPDTPGGVPYVRVADFPGDKLNIENIRRTTSAIDKVYARARLRLGDVLLSIRGTVGRVCVVPPELQNANITQDTARLSIQPALNTQFVVWFLRAFPTQNRMQKAVKGVAVRGINIGDVRALQLPVPPLAEQQEIVRRVEALFTLADQLEARYAIAKSHVDKLNQSILSKAFRGELVENEAKLAASENRDFEPANVLLERIRQQRAADGRSAQPRKRRKSKKASA